MILPDYKKSIFFPPAETVWWVGRYTRSISLAMLQEAYWNGYFPWPEDSESEEIPWVHPPERGFVLIKDFHIPHTVKRILRKGTFELRIDTAFETVMDLCSVRPDDSDTWITPEIKRAYAQFHAEGWAHSFETWNRETGELAGGLYGVSIGGVFAGESMFYRESGASKFALAALGMILEQCGVKMLDTQMVTNVTQSFGAEEYDREVYLKYLRMFRDVPLSPEQLRGAAAILKSQGKFF